MGNICRSPMAERLLVADALALGGTADDLYVHGAGVGGWHAGEPMDAQAARQVVARGGDVAGFKARKLLAEHVDASDLVLTATIEQVDYVAELRPDASARTFVFGEFGRLIRDVRLPGDLADPYARGVALVEAADRLRAGEPARDSDELDDPWGRPDSYFSRVADEIHATTRPLAQALFARQR
ncbi:phosphotyrosine protein phosphatase [Dactylosporangium vinaceum]|nr:MULTISPECIES: phosphotyrosine protein phosphatase [Dactylosporangium]UAC01526.1 phosphotyrosine protein phosphatase [Dactylosporangium vinaceum]UWZ49405.1 phosphotyrosine protein phosphatase [Dactylosporangium matsuzakiense]